MASVPKSTEGGPGVVVSALVALFLMALALSAGHHLAASSGGSDSVIPHIIGTPGDPCRDRADGHEVKTVSLPGRSLRGRIRLDCGQWRQIIRRAIRGGGGGRATIRQILACIQAALHRGDWEQKESTDYYFWRWGAGADDIALIVADATGRIRLAKPGPGEKAWAQCAKAAS
jgi:hypothetical protein